MNNNRELLSSVLKTTQMGQIGIRSVLAMNLIPELHNAMKSQLKEYDAIEKAAYSLAEEHRWTLPHIRPSVRFMTDQMSKLRLSFGNADSKAAAMMIQGNTRGIIKGCRALNRFSESDADISRLTNKLIETERANIEQMKPFL